VSRAIRTHRWKYAVTAPGIDGRSVLGSDAYTESHLYDLHVDPHELNNLVGSEAHRDLCDGLGTRLVARMVQAGEAAPTISPAPSFRVGQSHVTELELLM